MLNFKDIRIPTIADSINVNWLVLDVREIFYLGLSVYFD